MELDGCTLEELVGSNIEDLFREVAEQKCLTHGDISPCQALELEQISKNLVTLLIEYHNQNRR